MKLKQSIQQYFVGDKKSTLTALFFSLILIFLGFILYEQANSIYNWHWSRVWRYIGRFSEQGFQSGLLMEGFFVSIKLILWSMFLTLVFGFLLAMARLSTSPVLVLLASSCISFFRNTPLLLQLFIVYFIFAPIFGLSSFQSAVLSLMLFEGVYVAEIFRAGILTVPVNQWEASYSLGFGLIRTYYHVVFPQTLHNIIPSLAGQLISLIKDTSLVSAIAVMDLTMRARELIAETYLSFEIWIIVAIFYFVLTIPVSLASSLYAWFEKRKRI